MHCNVSWIKPEWLTRFSQLPRTLSSFPFQPSQQSCPCWYITNSRANPNSEHGFTLRNKLDHRKSHLSDRGHVLTQWHLKLTPQWLPVSLIYRLNTTGYHSMGSFQTDFCRYIPCYSSCSISELPCITCTSYFHGVRYWHSLDLPLGNNCCCCCCCIYSESPRNITFPVPERKEMK